MKKRAFSLLLAAVLLACLIPAQCFAAGSDSSEITGSWNGRHNGWSVYEFDSVLYSCSELSVGVTIAESSGNPYRTWLVYARDTRDSWTKIGSFVLKTNGELHTISLSKPMDISAVEVQLDGGYSTTSYYLSVYSSDAPLSAPSNPFSVPKPTPTPSSELSLLDLLMSDSFISGSFNGNTHHGSGVYELDEPLKNCTQFDLFCQITEYTGNPFRTWIVNGKTGSGDWVKLGTFVMDKDEADNGQSFTIKLSKAMNISAFSIELDGGAHEVSYYVIYSNAVTK